MSGDVLTRRELRKFLRHLMQVMREDKVHRAMRHSLKRAIAEFFYRRSSEDS